MELVTLNEIRAAAADLAGRVVRTPLLPCTWDDDLLVKPESLQPVGSFKLRGATHAIARLSPDRTARSFCVGAAELTTTALLIGFAYAIQVVLTEGQVIDTIIYALAQPLQTLPPALSAIGMFLVQSLTNLFIPSGSGQAYVTMPLMAPLADLVQVSRQTAVLAYQFGDGFTNIVVPTNAVLIGILAMAGIPYDRWLRFILPFMGKILVVASLALVVAVWIGY